MDYHVNHIHTLHTFRGQNSVSTLYDFSTQNLRNYNRVKSNHGVDYNKKDHCGCPRPAFHVTCFIEFVCNQTPGISINRLISSHWLFYQPYIGKEHNWRDY